MATSFPMEIEALDVPFAVVPNAAFPDATPVCVLTNNGAAPAFDTFIKSYFPGRALLREYRFDRNQQETSIQDTKTEGRAPGVIVARPR